MIRTFLNEKKSYIGSHYNHMPYPSSSPLQ